MRLALSHGQGASPGTRASREERRRVSRGSGPRTDVRNCIRWPFARTPWRGKVHPAALVHLDDELAPSSSAPPHRWTPAPMRHGLRPARLRNERCAVAGLVAVWSGPDQLRTRRGSRALWLPACRMRRSDTARSNTPSSRHGFPLSSTSLRSPAQAAHLSRLPWPPPPANTSTRAASA